MRTRSWAALACAGLIAGSVAVAQPPKTPGVTPASAKSESTTAEAPRNDRESLVKALSDSRTALGKLRDYTCVFTRQELRGGKLSAEEVAEMKVRTNPAGVYARFARPNESAGMEVAYTGAKKNLRMRYRPAGTAGAKGFQSIPLDDAKFLAANRHQVNDWTMAAVIDRVSTAVAREKTLNNPVEVYAADYQFAGQNVTRYEVYTRRPHAFRYAHRMLIYIDKKTNLPLRYEAYDQPKNGATAGDLIESYSFSDVKTNVGLGENAFDY